MISRQRKIRKILTMIEQTMCTSVSDKTMLWIFVSEAPYDLHSKAGEVKNMVMMLGILAFALLFTAIMNYILITISSIVNRTKEVAVPVGLLGLVRMIALVLSETTEARAFSVI